MVNMYQSTTTDLFQYLGIKQIKANNSDFSPFFKGDVKEAQGNKELTTVST